MQKISRKILWYPLRQIKHTFVFKYRCRVLLQYLVPQGVFEDAPQAKSLYTLAPAPIPRVFAWATTSPSLLPEGVPELSPEASVPEWLQNNAETDRCYPGKLPSLVRSPLSLALLLPESLTPSCSWTSCPLCQIILKSQITTAKLSPLEFFTVWLPLLYSWLRICYKLRKNILNSL